MRTRHWPCPSGCFAASSSPPWAVRTPPSAPPPADMPPAPHAVPPLALPPAAAVSGRTGRPGCGSSGGSRRDSRALWGKGKAREKRETEEVERFFFMSCYSRLCDCVWELNSWSLRRAQRLSDCTGVMCPVCGHVSESVLLSPWLSNRAAQLSFLSLTYTSCLLSCALPCSASIIQQQHRFFHSTSLMQMCKFLSAESSVEVAVAFLSCFHQPELIGFVALPSGTYADSAKSEI